jgi:hypothetical protein
MVLQGCHIMVGACGRANHLELELRSRQTLRDRGPIILFEGMSPNLRTSHRSHLPKVHRPFQWQQCEDNLLADGSVGDMIHIQTMASKEGSWPSQRSKNLSWLQALCNSRE